LDNIPSRAERIVVVKPGEDPVGDLFDDQLVVAFALFSAPEYPVRMALHVFYIALGVLILVFTEFDGEAGHHFLCVHNMADYNIYAVLTLPYYPKWASKGKHLPVCGHFCSPLAQ